MHSSIGCHNENNQLGNKGFLVGVNPTGTSKPTRPNRKKKKSIRSESSQMQDRKRSFLEYKDHYHELSPYHRRLYDCSRKMIRSFGYVKKTAQGSIIIGGIETCGAYGCSICATKKARHAAREIEKGLVNAREKGMFAYHLTITQQYDKKSMLSAELESHKRFRKAFFDGINTMKGIKFECRITSLGIVLCWHVHSHIIVFSYQELSPNDILRLQARWVEKTDGRASLEHGLNIELIEQTPASFAKISKYLAYQLVKTTDELLSDDKYKDEYQEYIDAIYRSHPLLINDVTRKALDIPKPVNKKIEYELVRFNRELFTQLITYDLLGELKRVSSRMWGDELIEYMKFEVAYCIHSHKMQPDAIKKARSSIKPWFSSFPP